LGDKCGREGRAADEFITVAVMFMVVVHFLRWPWMCYLGISWCTPVIPKIGQCHTTF
jgi:hypothetical protein